MLVELENLNDIKVGDTLCDDAFKKPFKVFAVSKNHILCGVNCFGKRYYTVYAKEPEHIYHNGNNMHNYNTLDAYYFRGPDNRLFGGFDFEEDNPEEYLNQFETGELEISWKRRRSLLKIYKSVNKKTHKI